MNSAALHASGWDFPKLGLEVDFRPPSAQCLARSSRRQDYEFQSQRSCCHAGAKLSDERGNIGISHRSVMTSGQPFTLRQQLIEMAAPTRRIRGALWNMPADPRCIQNGLNAP